MQAGDYGTAFKELKPLADKGDSRAQFFVGNLYQDGTGVAKSEAEAEKWYRKSAAQGNEDAKQALEDMGKH